MNDLHPADALLLFCLLLVAFLILFVIAWLIQESRIRLRKKREFQILKGQGIQCGNCGAWRPPEDVRCYVSHVEMLDDNRPSHKYKMDCSLCRKG